MNEGCDRWQTSHGNSASITMRLKLRDFNLDFGAGLVCDTFREFSCKIGLVSGECLSVESAKVLHTVSKHCVIHT